MRLGVIAASLVLLMVMVPSSSHSISTSEASDLSGDRPSRGLHEEDGSKDGTICVLDQPCSQEEEQPNEGQASASARTALSSQSGFDSSSTPAACLHFWYAPGCSHCARVKEHLGGLRLGKHPYLDIREHNAREEMDLYSGLLSDYDVPESKRGKVPVVYVGDDYCVGDKECLDRLGFMIDNCLPDGCACRIPTQRSAMKVGLVGVASLAAVDAVNVCALAVLIILITSVLTRFPEDRRRMLMIAFAFMGGIFAAYFAVGILIVLGFKSLAGIGSLSTSWIYRAVGVIAIALGIFNLKDFAWYGGGGFKLEVPESWRPRMKKIIGSVVSPRGAFVVGLIVSVFLLPCALGPYFVASGLLAGIPLGYALGWLVLYNVVFILPMLTITFVVYGGFGAITNIEEWRQNHLRTLHLFAGVILCGIGAAIVAGWI